MKRINQPLLIFSFLIGAAGMLLTQLLLAKPTAYALPPATTATYQVVYFNGSKEPKDLQTILNENSKDGWHLHSVYDQLVIFEK